MTIEEIRGWLVENKDTKEVISFFAEIAPKAEFGLEDFKSFLEKKEGLDLVQPITDQRVTQALKTYKEGHYEKDVKAAVAVEILKLNPTESPEQKQIRELREEVEKEKVARQRDNLRRQIVEEAAREKIPSWWVDDFSGNTIDEAKVFISKVKSFTEDVKKTVTNDLLTSGYKPGSGENGKDKPDLSKMSMQELVALEMAGKLDEALTKE